MGNIQIKERPKKNYSIFGNRPRHSSRSPFRDVVSPNSPYYKDFSPIRYSPINRERRSIVKESLRLDTSSRKSPKPSERQSFYPAKQRSVRKETEKVEDETAQVNAENRQKCEEIIKKVRNFNDFLVELKRKLKEDCASPKDEKMRKERGEVSLSVKLENQRVELEKYKKLVERQLSKTHSIQNISIHNANNGEKILTIQYEDLIVLEKKQNSEVKNQIETNRHEPQKHFGFGDSGKINSYEIIDQDKSHSQLSLRLMEISKNNQSNVSKDSKGSSYDKKLKQAKALWSFLKRKTEDLGEMLAKQQQINQNGEELRDYLLLKERVVKVNQLYNSLESANKHSIEVEKKIRGLLS